MPTETIKTDTDFLYSWTEIRSFFDDLGVLTGRQITYDDGIEQFDTFAEGERTESQKLDNPGSGDDGIASWSDITSYYSGGNIVGRVTNYDDGVMRAEDFTDGIRSKTTEVDLQDGNGGVRDWTQLETHYDQTGAMVARVTTYDHGGTKVDEFDATGRTRTTEDDLGDTRNFQTATTYFQEGQMVAKVTDYDNGQNRIEEFTGGMRSKTTQTDLADAANWDTKETYYDAGQQVANVITYDDGVVFTRQFENGARVQDTRTDVADIASWDQIDTYFDANGDVIGRQSFFDNGITKEEQYTNGQLASRTETDVNDVASWASRTALYDETGQLAGRQTTFDDGATREEVFFEGARFETIDTDVMGTRNYETLTTRFDQNGNMAERETIYDDGCERLETFVDGMRVSSVTQDLSADGSAKSWMVSDMRYDELGQLDIRLLAYDNGDATVWDYEAGDLLIRAEQDGNGDQPWEFRAFNYVDGAVDSVETYGSFEELTPELQALFLPPDVDTGGGGGTDPGDGGGGGGEEEPFDPGGLGIG